MAASTRGFEKFPWYYQLLIVAGICAGLLGLVWYTYLDPMQTTITAKKADLLQLQQQVLRSQQQERMFAQFKAQTADLQVELDRLKTILPKDKETDKILRQAQRSAETSGLKILRVGTRGTVDHDVYTEWPIDMEIVGTYHNLGVFLDKIRLLPRIVNISALKIQSRASTGLTSKTASVGATYTATTFVYKEDVAEANASQGKVTK